MDSFSYVYGHNSMDVQLVQFPDNTNFGSAAMLHDGADYRLYFQAN